MIRTTLQVSFSELASGLSCEMSKTLDLPYALRVGDNICEGDPHSDEALDFVVQSTSYELHNAALAVILDGGHGMPPGTVEPLRQLLFGLGWEQLLPIPASC